MRTNYWFETKLDNVLAEAGTKMTDSMMVFIDGATNELWDHWDKFTAGIDPKSGYINPFPNPPWEYNGPTITQSKFMGGRREAIIISPDNIKFTASIKPSTMNSGIELSYPGGAGYEAYTDGDYEWKKEWGPQTAIGSIHIDPNQATSKEHLREIIAHEVAHLVDPKLRAIKNTGADKKYTSDEQKYYYSDYQRQSHEIDAIMTSLADRRLREIMTPNTTPADVQNAIRNLQPKHDFERSLLKNGQWKRYLQTIYRFAQQRQQNEN